MLFDWEGEKEGDLHVKQGDILQLLEWVDPEWIRADNCGTEGMIPIIFVDVVEDLAVSGPRVLATYDFEAELPHELTFGTGDEIELLGVINDDWMRGRWHGKEGAFPSAFVEVRHFCCCAQRGVMGTCREQAIKREWAIKRKWARKYTHSLSLSLSLTLTLAHACSWL